MIVNLIRVHHSLENVVISYAFSFMRSAIVKTNSFTQNNFCCNIGSCTGQNNIGIKSCKRAHQKVNGDEGVTAKCVAHMSQARHVGVIGCHCGMELETLPRFM